MISVILPVYNNKDTICQVVDSYLGQSSDAEVEIIIIDDGSNDGTDETLPRYNHAQRVRIIRHEERQGVVSARNTGIQAASGDYLLFGVGDAFVSSRYIGNALNLFSNNHSIAGIVGPVIIHGAYQDDLFARYLNRTRGAGRHNTGQTLPPEHIIFTNIILQAGLVRSAGYFDEDFSGYGGHEVDYASRMIDAQSGDIIFSEQLPSYRLAYRPLKHTCDKFYQFGAQNLHRLIGKYPQFTTTYKINLLNSIPSFFRAALPRLYRFLYRKIPTTRDGKLASRTKLLPDQVGFFLIKFMLGLALLSGFQSSQESLVDKK